MIPGSANDPPGGCRLPLVGEGLAEIKSHMLELLRKDEITREEYSDGDLTCQMESTVTHVLEAELTGDETSKEVRKRGRRIINGALK